MSAQSGSLAIFGLFLLLAFVVPGLVYTVFIYIYFPEFWPGFINIDNWAGLFGIVVVFGLIITSICFTIEWLILIPHIYPRIGVERPDIPLLGKLEAHGKSTLYLNQVFGQYIMHLNVGIGVLLLSASYLLLSLWKFLTLHYFPRNFVPNFFAGLIVATVNSYIAIKVFTEFSKKASSTYREILEPKKAMVFDLDNTLVKTYEVYRKANKTLADWVQRLGAEISDVEAFVDRIFEADRELVKRFGFPVYDKKELLIQVCEDASIKPDGIDEALGNYLKALREMPEMKENADKTLAILRRKDCSLFLLSEGEEERIQRVATHHKFNEIFDEIISVNQKTQTTLNQLAQRLRDSGYSKLYLVGDSIRTDIMLGNSAGFETIWLPSKWAVNQPKNHEEWPQFKIENLIEIPEIVE